MASDTTIMHRSGRASRSSASALANKLRIIGGRWRGVRIAFPSAPTLRPSPDRVRETLFNWLQHDVAGSRCLDLFAGSGALGIEALSRGAAHVAFVDADPQVGRHLRATLHKLRVAAEASVHTGDALKYLDGVAQLFDIVFLDPPFQSSLLPKAIGRLTGGWLAPKAYIYLECPAQTALPELPAGWSVHRSKRAGQVGYHLLQARPPAASEGQS
jgi:16S rRNA (guanine966-N2)-methyltransferase